MTPCRLSLALRCPSSPPSFSPRGSSPLNHCREGRGSPLPLQKEQGAGGAGRAVGAGEKGGSGGEGDSGGERGAGGVGISKEKEEESAE